MYRTISLAAVIAIATLQGCATSPHLGNPGGPAVSQSSASDPHGSVHVAQFTEVPREAHAPDMKDHPLTSVVVTQCNLIVAVYMTMPDGRLLRFDHTAHVPAEQLLTMAYSATRSERVEVSCNEAGPEGYEKHDPV
jgi:hypothetical protein